MLISSLSQYLLKAQPPKLISHTSRKANMVILDETLYVSIFACMRDMINNFYHSRGTNYLPERQILDWYYRGIRLDYGLLPKDIKEGIRMIFSQSDAQSGVLGLFIINYKPNVS